MARFTDVHVYPYSGLYDQPWQFQATESGDVWDIDAFARGSRRLTERLSLTLRDAHLEGRSSSLRLFAMNGSGPDVTVTFEPRQDGAEFYFSHVHIPRGFRHLSQIDRDTVTFDAMSLAFRTLGVHLRWNGDIVEACLTETKAAGFSCEWTSDWKWARDRSHRIRLAMRMGEDGYGRGWFEMADATSYDAHHRSEEYIGWTWVENFRASAKSMRWLDSHTIRFDEHGREMLVDTTTGVFTRTWKDAAPRQIESDSDLAPTIPRAVREEPQMNIWLGGGGPVSALTAPYGTEAERLLTRVRHDPAWMAWIESSGLAEFSMLYAFSGAGPRVTVRVANEALNATIRRSDADLPDLEGAHEAAYGDLAIFFARVQKRLGLTPHPPLPLD